MTYGHSRTVDLPFDVAIERAKEALKAQGFGVLCEIDVRKTLQEKIGADFRPYTILGACNPQFAYRALNAEEQLGLLLPCNVVVQSKEGKTVVSAIDATAMLEMTGNSGLRPIAGDVDSRLKAVLDALAPAG